LIRVWGTIDGCGCGVNQFFGLGTARRTESRPAAKILGLMAAMFLYFGVFSVYTLSSNSTGKLNRLEKLSFQKLWDWMLLTLLSIEISPYSISFYFDSVFLWHFITKCQFLF